LQNKRLAIPRVDIFQTPSAMKRRFCAFATVVEALDFIAAKALQPVLSRVQRELCRALKSRRDWGGFVDFLINGHPWDR